MHSQQQPPSAPNAFEAVRPRGADVPPPRQVPRAAVAGCPAAVAGAVVLLFNGRGFRSVGLAPRVKGAISIESRAQAQASLDKSRRIARDWRQG
jgi:hypothetical protein